MVTTRQRPEISPGVGHPRTYATYTVPAGARVIYGQRILGHVRLVDAPAIAGQGRSWVIENNLEQDGMAGLLALVDDYVTQAHATGTIPASPSAPGNFLNGMYDHDGS